MDNTIKSKHTSISIQCTKSFKMYKNENHPMHLDPVLQSLFDQLKISDIKNCRLVNHQWSGKALNVLRRKTSIKLETPKKLKEFLSSSEGKSLKFIGFSFELCDWNESIAEYMSKMSPKTLAVTLTLKNEDTPNGFNILNSLLSNFCKKLIKLDITFETKLEQQIVESIPEIISKANYTQLTTLCLKNDRVDHPEGVEDLWISIIAASPKLKALDLLWDENEEEFMSKVCLVPSFAKIEYLTLRVISPEISQSICRVKNLALKRLKIRFVGDSDLILSRMANSLEELEFITPNESALSPITFPVMSKLKILNAGNSQLSFPTIIPEQFPVLEELIVTYWDWVYTFEQVPDIHYYWRTTNPHSGIKKFTITFPSLSAITGNYQTMENYSDFCVRISQKFPSLDTIRFKNLTIKPSIAEFESPGTYKIRETTEQLGERLKDITVIDYDKDIENPNSSDLMSVINSSCVATEVWDLNPLEWLKIWTGNPSSQLNYDIFNMYMVPDRFTSLRVVKLLWVDKMKLYDFVQYLPALEHFEIIGGCCIDRFDRRKMKQERSKIFYIQHKCCCPAEDLWIFEDVYSAEVFQRLFKGEFLKAKGFMKKIQNLKGYLHM